MHSVYARRRPSAIASRATGRLARACATAVAGLVVMSAACGGSQATDDATRQAGQEAEVEVVAVDNSFEPDTLELRAAEEVTISIRNDGSLPHDFVIASEGLDTDTIEPGKAATVSINVPANPVEFVCTIHPEMKGRIVPEE
jgi:plastocyanin